MSQNLSNVLFSVPFRYCLKQHRVTRKDKVAIIEGISGETITYGDLHDRVSRMAGWLVRNGVRYGDRVACLSLNSKAYTEFFFALAWIGAVAVPLNIRLHPKEFNFIIQDSGAKAIFSDGFMVESAETAISGISALDMKILSVGLRDGWVRYDELIRDKNEPIELEKQVSGDTLFMLLYTSGTTGKPKGCMIPQRSWTGYSKNMAACFQMGERDVYLAFLPFFHVAGFGTAFSQLILGGTIITAPLPDPKQFYSLIEKYRVSIMFLVPGISASFIYDDGRKGSDLSSLKTFIDGAGTEKLELINDVEKTLGAKYYGIYGQTESGSKITWADSDMIRENPTTYGYVMPFFDYRIMDENDQELEPGMVGELCIRGETVMMGYWNRPEATAETLKNDWHHTGDLFMLMDNGQVKMIDRKKYLIKTGGENVYPQEVEQVLLSHEGISDAAVIGIPDEKWGEAVKAFIVLKEGTSLSRREITDWVSESIAGYKKPRFIEFVGVIPRNVSGKILKNELSSFETTNEQKV
jgi:fatty-acyl-CoA synthase